MTARRIALAALLLAAVVAAALGLPIASWIATAAEWAQQHRAAAGALFVGGYAVAAVLLVPGAIMTLAAGFVFGLPLGAALASAGSVLGAAAAFAVGRVMARDWVAQRALASPRFRALAAATHRDGFFIVLLARLSPLIPYTFLNYLLSLTPVRFKDYVLASWIGMLPVTVVYVYTGSLAKSLAGLKSVRGPSWTAYAVGAIGFAATVALTALITRRATSVLRERLAAEPPSLPGGAE